jgi:hypothetical protein
MFQREVQAVPGKKLSEWTGRDAENRNMKIEIREQPEEFEHA